MTRIVTHISIFPYSLKVIRFIFLFTILSLQFSVLNCTAQVKTPCTLIEEDIFKISRSLVIGEGPVVFKMAVNNKEVIAISSCNKRVVYFISPEGNVIDSIATPFKTCLRNMEFDEWNNLLLIENTEAYVYRVNLPSKQIEKLAYNKPEDWFYYQNHYYKFYELSSIPAYYYNPNYIQESYFTRFPYGYNLYMSYSTGLLYQTNFNFIKRIGDKKTYEGLQKKDLWFSDLINNKSKILLVDDATKRAVYFDRSLKLVSEDFINEQYEITDCGRGISEAAQFDFATNMKQEKIYGIRTFDKQWLHFSTWTLPDFKEIK